MQFLVVSPDRYGRFGHQTLSISAGLLLARITGCSLVCPRYMYFCDKWNKYSDFARSSVVTSRLPASRLRIGYLENDSADYHGNRKWDLSSTKQIHEVAMRIIESGDNSLIHLPFDQSSGSLMKLISQRAVRSDFKEIFSFPEADKMPQPYICLHVRRGDCTLQAHPSWYVGDDFYLALIRAIASSTSGEIPICVCTQGDASWLESLVSDGVLSPKRLRIRTTDQLFVNDAEIEDFCIMKDATVLFCASSFSHIASILGNQRLVFDISRASVHPLQSAVVVNPDAEIAESLLVVLNALAQALGI